MKTIQQLLSLIALLAINEMHAQTPRLSSDPSAMATIFLNFDGEYVSGTSWNWEGAINAQPAGLAPDDVIEIFNRVAEDYRPFNINVTTDPAVYAAATYNKRTHVIITPTSGWYGSAGGVSFVGSFTWGDDTPAWVFSALLNNNTKNIAEACSHEAGHTLGLQHQSSYNASCVKTAEYNAGQGDGEIGWAPIMGVGYSKNVTTWHTGANTAGCDVIQNDMDVIASAANNITFRSDDYGDSVTTAAGINMQEESFQINGLINQMTDADVFNINLDHLSRLKINAVPQNVGTGNKGANIDIKVFILNAAADTLGSYNPSALLDAGIDTSLQAGTYYIAVKGTGNVNHTSYGSLGAYVLTGNLLNTLPVHQFVVNGKIANGYHTLSWTYISDDPVQNIIIESSSDGRQFYPLYTAAAVSKSFSYQPGVSSLYYRLKAVTVQNGAAYYSNIIHLFTDDHEKRIRLQSAVVTDQVVFTSNLVCAYQLYDATGKLISKGSTTEGTNRIDVQDAASGILVLRFTDGTTNRIEKLIKR